MENDNPQRREWTEKALDALAPPTDWEPNAAAARIRFDARVLAGARSRRYWMPAAAAAAIVSAVVIVNPGTRARAQQVWQWLTVGNVEIVRVDFASLPEQARSLHPTLLHEPAQPQLATDAGHAAKMAGFVPRLPPAGILPGLPRLSVMAPMSFGMTVNTSDLEFALRMAGVFDQTGQRSPCSLDLQSLLNGPTSR
jgi:hypothetical protein